MEYLDYLLGRLYHYVWVACLLSIVYIVFLQPLIVRVFGVNADETSDGTDDDLSPPAVKHGPPRG